MGDEGAPLQYPLLLRAGRFTIVVQSSRSRKEYQRRIYEHKTEQYIIHMTLSRDDVWSSTGGQDRGDWISLELYMISPCICTSLESDHDTRDFVEDEKKCLMLVTNDEMCAVQIFRWLSLEYMALPLSRLVFCFLNAPDELRWSGVFHGMSANEMHNAHIPIP